LVNKENEKMCAIINQDFIWLGNSQIAELTSKTIKGNCVIVNTFYPTTAEILKFNGLKYLEEETLDVIGSDDLTQELWTKPIWACRVV
jgi:thiamine pyrophosphokinase